MVTDEKTSKEKYIRIDNKFVYTDIFFRIDAIRKDVLKVLYVIHALNGEFTSQPLVIDLTKDTTNLINEINHTNLFVKLQWQETTYRFADQCIDGYIHIYKDDKKDDMGRNYITFGYLVDTELVEINIPIVIYPRFVATLVEILQRKDIIDDDEDHQDTTEDNPTDSNDEV